MFPEIDIIETPENVHLERNLAGIGIRFIACLIDHILIAGIIFLLMLTFWGLANITYWTLFSEGVTWLIAIFILMQFIVYWGYFAFFELKKNGQTPGKKNQKVRVVKNGGGGITFSEVAIRNLFRPLDMFLGAFCMFLTKKWQRLGDLAAGTVVVSEVAYNYSAKDSRGKELWEKETSAEALQATRMSPEDYRVITNFWMRRHELTDEARRRLLEKLIRPLLERYGHFLRGVTTATIEHIVEDIIKKASQAEEHTSSDTSNTETRS